MVDKHEGGWHLKVIPASTEETLKALRDARLLDTFYLAGGTGLALQFGHRLSLDLDFFSQEKFEEERDPTPKMLVGSEWNEIKQFFLRETPRLLQ